MDTALLDTAPCGWLSFGDDGKVVIVNAPLADRLGMTREEILGQHVERLFPISTRIFYQTHFFPLVRMHGVAREVFLLLRAKSGEDVGMLCNANRRENDGHPVTDCVLLEVNERRKYEDALLTAKRTAEEATRQLEEQAVELEMQHQQLLDQSTQLERAQALAEAANRAKSDFLATMSHELRTPLNAIGGYTQLLVGGIYGAVAPKQIEALERIERAQRHLLGLINDILNLARVEAGRVEYQIADVLAAEVVAELAAMIEPQMAAKRHAYRVNLPAEPLVVRADHEKLVQILLNLLSNAVKFTEPGGRITLTCSMDARGRDATFEVSDTGRGIPPDRIEAVFEPFIQIRGDAAAPNEGTGLGLAISRNLARGMGGDLTAHSVLGKGSTFTLTLLARG